MKSKSGNYSGIAELIKKFVSNSPEEELTFKHLTKLVKQEYPESAWNNNWARWRYHTIDPKGNYYDEFSDEERAKLEKIFEDKKHYKNVNINKKAVNIDQNLIDFCKTLIKVAIEFEKLCGKKLNVTGEIGEILICHKLGLELIMDNRAPYDAIDKEGKEVQIKCRRSETENLPKDGSSISKVNLSSFDYLLLGILDRNYNLYGVWKAPYSKIKRLIEKQGNNTPTISSIKQIGEPISL